MQKLAKLVGNDKIVVYDLENGLFHFDDISCSKWLTRECSKLTRKIEVACCHFERQAEAS